MNKLLTKLIISLTLSLIAADKIMAFCIEPSVSFLDTPIKPSVPYCVNEWNNTHTCDEWELSNYYGDIESYNNEVENFINELNDYIDESVDYAKCRMAELE